MSDLHPSSGPAGHDDDSLLPGDPDPYATGEQPAVGRRAAGGSRRAPKKKRGKGLGCLVIALVLIAGVVGGLYVGVSWLADRINGSGEPEDFEGVASVEECATAGDVEITVPAGYSAGQIGSLLAEQGVVASSGAFTAAVANDSVRDGTRSMCEGMTGAQAAELMTNADYIGAGGGITITAGYTKAQTFDLLAGATDISVSDFEAAAEDPSLPLPAEAEGDVEGYLYPDSYDFGSDPTAVSILTQMIERWSEAATEAGLVDDAVPGFTQHQLLTLASIIQKEVLLPEERPQVAEVIYDRLADECAGVPAGMLQMDSTINFILGSDTGTAFTTEEDRQIDSPYNTYRYPGLPPGPIGAPSEASMEAAVNPSSEGYCYFVAAGDGSNSSYFAAEYADHLDNVDRARANQNG